MAEPKGKKHDGVALLYIQDIFGIWQNSKLMADQFAANGYHTIIIDVFNGDVFPNPPPQDIMKWLAEGTDGNNPHTKEAVDVVVEEGLKYLKEQGFTKIGAVGYCFGAKVSWLIFAHHSPRLVRADGPHPVSSTLSAITRTASRSATSLTPLSSTRTSWLPSPAHFPSPPPRRTRSSRLRSATSPRRSCGRSDSLTRSTCSAVYRYVLSRPRNTRRR